MPGGRTDLVLNGPFGVWGYDPRTGEELWKVRYDGFSNVSRPVTALGMVYVVTNPAVFCPDNSSVISAIEIDATNTANLVRDNCKFVPHLKLLTGLSLLTPHWMLSLKYHYTDAPDLPC